MFLIYKGIGRNFGEILCKNVNLDMFWTVYGDKNRNKREEDSIAVFFRRKMM